jgi:hypothetical protein
MSQPTGFAVGDRVRINSPHSVCHGMTGVVKNCVGSPSYPYTVQLGEEREYDAIFTPEELERVDSLGALIALAEQCGAVEFNRWIADGMLCRRFITPDGTIDLTVRVP